MTTKIIKSEVTSDEIKGFGEDAATAINEILGLYGYDDENERNELSSNFHKKNCSITMNLDNPNQSTKPNEKSIKFCNLSSSSSDKDSSSRENSKSPTLENGTDHQLENSCSWCHHSIDKQSKEAIGSLDTVFCSENCFIFWRRASFKRAKTCDFCKNVRNAISYVDFNDGATQLQFCSDKCLNQYKMQIFCRETQAHLELNPHLKDKNESDESLITPELWMKNCRTRSPTPEDYEFSKSSLPLKIVEGKIAFSKMVDSNVPSSSSKNSPLSSSPTIQNKEIILGKKPMINVLPSSKLLSRNMLHNRNYRRRRVSSRLIINNKVPQKSDDNNLGNNSTTNINFPENKRSNIHSQTMSNSSKPSISADFNRQPLQQFMLRPPMNLLKYRLPFSMSSRIPLIPQNKQLPSKESNYNSSPIINPVVPPSIVLVPYPIPLPIVLPIPLPITAFINAYKKKDNENWNKSQDEMNLGKINENEKPLDLSSEQSLHENEKKLLTQSGDDCEDEDMVDTSNLNRNFVESKHTLKDKISDVEELDTIMKTIESKDMHERNRPLRKRKIVSSQEDKIH